MRNTAGKPHSVRLTPGPIVNAATGEDLSFILIEGLDREGNLCTQADNLIHFEIAGSGEIAGVGNGDQRSYEPFQATTENCSTEKLADCPFGER